jgi:hypothetical protein
MKITEEPNKLLKIKLQKQGANQWLLKPVSDKSGTQARKGKITFRGSEDKLKLLLRRLKAADFDSDPDSVKNVTYQQMIDLAKATLKGNYIWVYTKYWNQHRNDNKITVMEKYNSDINIFLQRNIDRMDVDTLIGVLADKFNIDLEQAEEIVMAYKTKRENKKDVVEITKPFSVISKDEEVLLEKGDRIKIVQERVLEPWNSDEIIRLLKNSDMVESPEEEQLLWNVADRINQTFPDSVTMADINEILNEPHMHKFIRQVDNPMEVIQYTLEAAGFID